MVTRPLALTVILLAAAARAPSAGPRCDAQTQVPEFRLPGGASGLARTLGISETLPRSRVMLTAIRLLWEAPEGVDRIADRRRAQAIEYLRRAGGEPAKPDEIIPAYVPSAVWGAILPDADASIPAAGILGSRRAALFYYGVASLDAATRAYLLGQAPLLRLLSDDPRVGVFATLGRALHVRDGRVDVPGGAEALPLWEDVVGEPATRPAAFALSLFARDGGRLALLYDGVGHFEPAQQRYALGFHLPAAERLRRFRALYGATSATLEMWQPSVRPFERTALDAVHLLASTPIGADGQPVGPAWPKLWEGLTAPRLDGETEALRGHYLPGSPARLDAASLVERVCVTDVLERRARAATWLFAGRVFSDAPMSSAPDLLIALSGFRRYPALLLTLDRMGIRSPAAYARAVRTARRLSRTDLRLWQFQAALAILERARWNRAIDASTAESLFRSLAAAIPEQDDLEGAVARWLQGPFLEAAGEPVLPAGLPVGDRPVEARVLAAMAGAVRSPANTAMLALPPIEWEGLRYRLDPGGSELRHLLAVRQKQGGAALDAVLELGRIGTAVRAARSLEAARAAVQPLPGIAESLFQALPAANCSFVSSPLGDPALVRATVERTQTLRPPERKTLERIGTTLVQAMDCYLAQVLPSIAYAPHLGDPSGPAMLGGDPATVHDLRLSKPSNDLKGRTAWELAVETRDAEVGWRLTGSLLGLDVALGRLALRRPLRETLPGAPRVSASVRQVFTESAVFCNAFDLVVDQGAGRAIREATARGEQRVAALAGAAPPDISVLAAEAGLDEWREQALHWTVEHEPGRRSDLFSLAELARLGALDTVALRGVDAWGTSAFSRNGGLESSYPARLPWTTLAGRVEVHAVAALVPDLALGLAEALARRGLPAPMTAGLLLVATQDFLDTVRTSHEDDWEGLVAHARAIAGGDIEDYVAALTVTGPLVAEQTETQHDPQV